jgi:2-keto-4-pentenoate hydratase/2-oxohepta-3-ene-1,7-dioic acid hydratase in catechol pathway
MRLVSFRANGHPRAALLRDDGCVYDIWGVASRGARASDRTLEAILEGGLLDEVRPVEDDDGVPVAGLQLMPPITRPGKILCIGLVSTGTPAGVGSLRDPKVWLKPGDEVVISSPQLGVLETRLA